METAKVKVLIGCMVLFLVGGCAAAQPDKQFCPEKGRLNAQLFAAVNGECKIVYRYQNGAKHVQKPLIDIVAYDENDTVVDQDKIYFSEVPPGGIVTATRKLQCDNRKIVKIYIKDAVDQARCYGYNCSPLCEIKDTTLKF